MDNNISSEELFNNIATILDDDTLQHGHINHMMLETLQLAVTYALSNTHHDFGDLSSKVTFVCNSLNMSSKDINAIHRMRRHSISSEDISNIDLPHDCRSLAYFISKVFNVTIPANITCKIPHYTIHPESPYAKHYPYIRCVVRQWDNHCITATATNIDTDSDICILYTESPDFIDLSYLSSLLQEGMQLNLIDSVVKQDDDLSLHLIPNLVIVEPDFMIDISAISACFEDFGHHPLLYTLNRMKARANNRYTILGNFAGSALDDIINDPNFNFADTLRNNFREKALEYCCANDFNGDEFKINAVEQTKNIQQMVKEIFATADRGKALLEPTFICERLGLQGRIDLMTTDMGLIVEQKSGKNGYFEKGYRNRYGGIHVEKHYVQVLLYYYILMYNFCLNKRKANIQLLYSRYTNGLIQMEPLQKLFLEAIQVRNEIVASQYDMAQNGFEKYLSELTPETLNVNKLRSNFYEQYIYPKLLAITMSIHAMKPVEKKYFCRMMQFVMKEQLMSKTGGKEGVGNSNADLWNMALSEKKETGNIFTGLTIIEKYKSNRYNGYDTIILNIPDQDFDFLPNFRQGDMVYLYSYKKGQEPNVCRSILFKGVLSEIHTNQLTVHLSDGQQNENILKSQKGVDSPSLLYAIEHGGSDLTGNAIHSLYSFISAAENKRDLILGQRTPQKDDTVTMKRKYDPDIDEMLLRAKQAKDYFLLVGPPGTGKTSRALQFLVREAEGNTLLLAYTNRAVDEICEMLSENNIDYIRIGNEYSCDQRFRNHLIGHIADNNPQLSTLRDRLLSARIIVSTISMIQSKEYIFDIKHFNLAIIDEASQILESNIIGILTNVDKFILIGDYKQLPAVVQQGETESAVGDTELQNIHLTNCRNSLFERLIQIEKASKREDFIGILHKQGRMHPKIAEFPNHKFYYQEQLVPIPLKHQQENVKYPRIMFIPSEDCRQPNISDKVNTSEARIVAHVLQEIFERTYKNFDAQKTVGVIVPYRNQIAMIRKEIEKLNIPELETISIDTIERYQGSQRDVIIYSFTVQSSYQLDFLTASCFIEDGHMIDRKLNVAITRARKQLIVTGNTNTLRKNALFSEFIDYMEQ